MISRFFTAVFIIAAICASGSVAHGRGFGGSASRSAGGYSGSHSYSGESTGHSGGASESYNHSYEGSHGGSYDASGTRGAAYGPNGAAAGGTRDVSATGPDGRSYNSDSSHGAAAGPYGAAAGGSRSTTATGYNGQTYSGQHYGAAATGQAYGAYGAAVVRPGGYAVGAPVQAYAAPAPMIVNGVQTYPPQGDGIQPAYAAQAGAVIARDPDADRAAYLRSRLRDY